MSRHYSFNFYLSTKNNRNDSVHYLSNNDIKRNYMNIGYQEVSNVVCFAVDAATYHVFTLPFEFVKLRCIGNIFPNIIFNNVIELWVRDVVPFEHEFFLRIAQAFPLTTLHHYHIMRRNHLTTSNHIESLNILILFHLLL